LRRCFRLLQITNWEEWRGEEIRSAEALGGMGERREAHEGRVSSLIRGVGVDLGKVVGERSEEGGDLSSNNGGKGSLRGIRISFQEESKALICGKILARTETSGFKRKRVQKHRSRRTKAKLRQGCKIQQGLKHQAEMKI
jgi:hypothetical protein